MKFVAVEHEALNNAPEQNDIFKGVNSDKIFDNEDRSDNAPVVRNVGLIIEHAQLSII